MGIPAATQADQQVNCIDLSSFEERQQQIVAALMDAATTIGFFQARSVGTADPIPLLDGARMMVS